MVRLWETGTGCQSGIGQDKVKATEFGDRVGKDRLKPCEVSDIGLFGHDAASGLLYEVDRFVKVFAPGQRVCHAVDLFADVNGDDVGAFLGETHSVAASLPPRSAGDERNLAVELCCHELLVLPVAAVAS
jgi:hypothetical protein